MVRVTMAGLGYSVKGKGKHNAVALLREDEGPKVLLLWLDDDEAGQLTGLFDGKGEDFPQTHDLLAGLFHSLGLNLVSVILEGRGKTASAARLMIAWGEEQGELEARPGDAVALALRLGVPIFAGEKFLTEPSSYKVNGVIN
ncbi:MAG: bifunctional nuclease family protein [Firmicutes bacterium]|nr:bifunctional nuclease family protein [Bacillota bacterium]